MNHKLPLGFAGLAGLLFSAVGCMDSRTVLLLEKDGSGVIEQTLYTKQADMPMGGPAKPAKLTPEQEMQVVQQQSAAAAKQMGEGVSLKSVDRLEPRGQWKGVKVVYTFTDVNNLRLGPAPQAGAMTVGGDQAIRFQFTKGDSPKLTITMPPMKSPAQEAPGAPGKAEMAGGEEMLNAMLPMLLDGAHIELQIKVKGRITETDASYVNPRRDTVGLMRADLDGLGKDPAAMQAFKALQKIKDPKVLQEKMQETAIRKYFKFETKPKIEIEFN